MTQPIAGDIVLYPAGPKSEFSSRLVIAGEIMAGLGAGLEMYSHAAILANSPGYQFEAKFPFTGWFKIDTSRSYEIWRIGNPTLNQRAQIINWCKSRLGKLYNIVGVLTFGLIELPDTYYCSQFACLAYASAGLHPGDKIMSPDSIPQYPGARMIYRYVPPKEAL